MLSPESIASPDAEQKMVGSLVVFEGSSVEEVKKLIEDDIYYTSGVVCPARLSMQILTSHVYFKVGSRTH